MGLPIIFFPEAEYFWICECLQALCSSTSCFRVTVFDIWLVMLLPPLRPVVATTNCWKEIVNWNWVDIFVILFQIALQFNPFTVCYIGKCSTAQSLESSIMLWSSHILSWNLKIYISEKIRIVKENWIPEQMKQFELQILMNIFFFSSDVGIFDINVSRRHHLSFRY